MNRHRPLRRLSALATLAFVALLAYAPAALGADGVGLWGRTDDKVVTYWGFAVIAFFAILVTVLSIWQLRAETRKDRLRAELDRVHRPTDD